MAVPLHYDAPAMRFFTPAEANALLARLVPVVDRAKGHLSRVRELSEASPATREQTAELETHRRELANILRSIENDGVLVKGLEPALLDFPAMYRGREVYLCWKDGEKKITHWHPTSTGFAGRQPLEAGEPSAWEWRN